ncbi:MAG TPA: PIN domain-containing protein [Burkholderiaceae bacterium]
MTVLEPNALSALMQRQPDDQVVAWLDNHHAESIWISSITLFEARYELALLAPDQRKSLLQERFDLLVQDDLENRVLQFDADAATQAAHLAAERNWCVGIRFGALTCPHEEIAPYTLSAHLASH